MGQEHPDAGEPGARQDQQPGQDAVETTDDADPGDPRDVPGAGARQDDDELHTALPPKVESWRKRSTTGAILTGFALGLKEVFDPERRDPPIVMETSGEPPRELPVEAEIDQVPPKKSVVKIRPWLLDNMPEDRAQTEEQPPAADRPDGDAGDK